MPNRMRRAAAREISAKLRAARSLMPVSEAMPADSRASWMAAAMNEDSTPVFLPRVICASASERASLIFLSWDLSFLCAIDSSINLAMKMVQVTSELAKA